MLLTKYIYNKLFSAAPPIDWYIQEYKSISEEFDALDTNDEDAQNANAHVEESYMPNAEFFRYRGIITHIYPNGSGRIDGKYVFSAESAAKHKLKVGHKISCTARKISEDQPVVIYTIDSIDQDSWCPEEEDLENVTASPLVPLNIRRKMVRGEIKAKLNGEIVIDTYKQTIKNIKLVISEIGCTFNPMEGDQVEVEVEYGIDPEDSANNGLIGYHGMRAIDTKPVNGKITSFKKRMQYGLIDEKYLFYLDVLQHSNNQNFVPNKGDTVYAMVIESHQKVDDKEYFYRCITLTHIKMKQSDREKGSAVEPANDPNEFVESDDEIDDEDCGVTFTKNSALKVSLESGQSTAQLELIATNRTHQRVRVSAARFSNEIIASQIECNALYSPQNISPKARFFYRITVKGLIRGTSKLKIDFEIGNKHSIRRCIQIDVKTVSENAGCTRVAHSKAYTKKIYSNRVDTVKGKAPVTAPHFIENKLKNFPVPDKLFDDTMNANHGDDLLNTKYGEIFDTLTHRNYKEYFHHLMHFEECNMRHEFRQYDQDRGHFVRDGEYLAYEMKRNIFECRPSIVIGDIICAESLLQSANAGAAMTQYQGFIHKIRRHRLLLKFSDEFHNSYLGEDYKLIFRFSRSKFIKQHNAIERIGNKLENCSDFLFPIFIKTSSKVQLDVQMVAGELELAFPPQRLHWYNQKLNEIQKNAVLNVLRGEAKMYPYLVFGPPGTGKTSTLIEMILQLYRKGNTRIIVAAPSNSAANLITKLLNDCNVLKEGEFARIVSQNSIERDQIPDELRKHCITVDIAAPRSTAEPQNPFENGIRVQCNSDVLKLHRILISTCNTFGSLLYMSFKTNHFTHAIIDEAGQCTEPEIAIPVSLLGTDGQMILAGDPHQLGPVVHSQIAKRCGLSKSLLSRLLDYLPYRSDVGRNGGYDERLVTQLLYNYRSIPSILEAYSKLSYESKLIPTILSEDSDEFKLLAKVQAFISPHVDLKHSPKFGVYFMGVRGTDEKTNDSTSWRNLKECVEVVTVLDYLFRIGVTEDQIGIITPYTLQVKEIRNLCDACHEDKQVKVGSVEEFQGQERDVIIISTVRSRAQFISHDGKYGLGFIKNKNRLNVAISRARAMLIIVGNPYVLVEDENWQQIIHSCYANGSYSGCKIPEAACFERE